MDCPVTVAGTLPAINNCCLLKHALELIDHFILVLKVCDDESAARDVLDLAQTNTLSA